jgi:hypothetical protein
MSGTNLLRHDTPKWNTRSCSNSPVTSRGERLHNTAFEHAVTFVYYLVIYNDLLVQFK